MPQVSPHYQVMQMDYSQNPQLIGGNSRGCFILAAHPPQLPFQEFLHATRLLLSGNSGFPKNGTTVDVNSVFVP